MDIYNSEFKLYNRSIKKNEEMPGNRMLSNTMKGSKIRCMFYCIYKNYIYIIDWLIDEIGMWMEADVTIMYTSSLSDSQSSDRLAVDQ